MIYLIIGLITAGLISYFLFFRQNQNIPTTKSEPTSNNGNDTDFPPKPKWKPNLPIDIERIYEKAKYYTGEKLQLAVFQNGTVTFFSNRVDNIEDSAKATLDKIYNAHPDFKPMTMDDGNYLIEYSQPAFTIVFKDEIEKHWDYIDKNHQDGICRAEVLINAQAQHNAFDSVGKICLFGRAKMFMDAQAPKVVKTFDPFRQWNSRQQCIATSVAEVILLGWRITRQRINFVQQHCCQCHTWQQCFDVACNAAWECKRTKSVNFEDKLLSMTRQAIIERTVKAISQLPEEKAEEISDFAEFIMKQYEEQQLTKGIQRLTASSQAFDFLKDEEDIYTEGDLKEKYNG